jgi:hypothetical protein
MTPRALKALVARSFSDAPFPATEDVVSHECVECNGMRAAFGRRAPANVDAAAVLAYATSLALFTPSAFRHFLASFLLYAIDHPESEVASSLPYALGPEEVDEFYAARFGLFSPEEKTATLQVLRYLRAHDPFGSDNDVYDLVERHWAAA